MTLFSRAALFGLALVSFAGVARAQPYHHYYRHHHYYHHRHLPPPPPR